MEVTSKLCLQVDQWIEYAPILEISSLFEETCAFIDKYLVYSTFLAGYDLTIADVAIWTALTGSNFLFLTPFSNSPLN